LNIFPLKNIKAKQFYAQKVASEQLSVRELRNQINQKVFERTTIANSQLMVSDESFASNTFKDPYFLDFLGLKEGYLENDLEKAILERDLPLSNAKNE
jgi:predicted nuclease of restriction endonuclease-like (RecB) superfamily